MISLLIINQSKERVPRKFLDAWMQAVQREFRRLKVRMPASGELSVVFLDVKAARALNKQYRGRDYATDVLSFEDGEGLGELVLCPAVLRRQALEHDLPLREEMGYMVLHGFLHLLGYDHETNEKDAAKMFAIQDAVFEKLRARVR